MIGTHALLEEKVIFADLGLVVVDEQHRFGVEQRAALTDKAGTPPHVLVMTATPIPRTVAMTVFGDLETSTLTELPAGRAPIQTNVVPLAEQPGWFGRVWERVREEVGKGHQVYVVCPRITGDEPEQGETDQLDVDEDGNVVAPAKPAGGLAAVEEVAAQLAEGPLAGLRVEKLHGRMPPDEKDARDARLRRRRRRRAGRDHRDRGRRRRRQRDRDGAPRRRPVRRLPAPPAARPGRPRRPARASACWSPAPRSARRRGTGWTPSRRPPTASSSAGSTSSSAARETFSASRSPGTARGCRICACCATRRRSSRRGRPPSPSSTPTRTSTGRPIWPMAVSRLEESRAVRLHGEVDDAAIIGGRRRADDRASRHRRGGARHPARPATGCARRCSPRSSPGAARCAGCASSTCTPAPVRSGSRRGPGAPAS